MVRVKRFARSLLLLAGLASLPACAATEGVVVTKPAAEPTRMEQAAAPPPAPVPTRVATSRTVVVHFDSDSADIRAGAMQVLYGAALDLRNTRLTAIRVVGHADASGRRTYNQRLSERRAAAVADQLRKLGLGADLFEVRGAGETPATPRAKGAAWAASADDRRVEITFDSVEVASLALPASAATAQAAPAGVTAAMAAPHQPVAPCPALHHAAATEMVVDVQPVWLRSADKPAIKRNLLANGTTWLPPPAA